MSLEFIVSILLEKVFPMCWPFVCCFVGLIILKYLALWNPKLFAVGRCFLRSLFLGALFGGLLCFLFFVAVGTAEYYETDKSGAIVYAIFFIKGVPVVFSVGVFFGSVHGTRAAFRLLDPPTLTSHNHSD